DRAHDLDLLALLDDDSLGETPQSLILAVAQLQQCHVDRTSMVRHHHPGEVAIWIAARGDVHPDVHASDDFVHERIETVGRFTGGGERKEQSAKTEPDTESEHRRESERGGHQTAGTLPPSITYSLP